MIKQYSVNIIHNPKTQNEWKIQLALAINFVSSKDLKKLVLCIEIVIILILRLAMKQIKLSKNFLILFYFRKKMKDSEFVNDSTHLLHYKLHKINSNRG